ADRIVRREAGLERRRRGEQHARECRADGGEQRHARERGEDAPSEPPEHVAPRPQTAELRALTRPLLPLPLLLDASPCLERRLILGPRLPLGHHSRFPFALTLPPRACCAKLARLPQQI